jgi:RimJ/RimL family protein N-acetyltransferase
MEQTEADGQSDRPLLNIVGEKIALGPVQKSMLPAFERWGNDFAVTMMSRDQLLPLSREQTEAEYEQRGRRKTSGDFIEFAIYERASWRLIGTANLRHINHVMRNASYGIVIGEKDCWGKGYGTETTILMLDYAFTVLGLHNVLLSTYGYNERGVRAYTRAGFRVVGRWREAARVSDQVYDIIFMDCLSTEFRSPLRRVIDLP